MKRLDIIAAQVSQHKPSTFTEFHAIVNKSMPSAAEQPEMYNICFDLMKLSWESACQAQKDSV